MSSCPSPSLHSYAYAVQYPLEKPPTQVGYNITQYFVSIVPRPGSETPMFNGPPQISPRNKPRSVPVSMSPVALPATTALIWPEQSYVTTSDFSMSLDHIDSVEPLILYIVNIVRQTISAILHFQI